MSFPAWTQMTHPDVTGRLGLAKNEYGTSVTVFICSSCHNMFTVTGDASEDTWGTACLSTECDSYDVERDVDLMFEIEPWRIRRDDQEN